MRDNKPKVLPVKSVPAWPPLKVLVKRSSGWVSEHILFVQSALSLGLAFSISLLWIFSGSAQSGPAYIRQVRVIEADKTGLQNPSAVAFSSRANVFLVMEEPGQFPPLATEVIALTPFGTRAGTVRIAAPTGDPINTVFDNRFHRLLALQFPENQLLEIKEKPDGTLDRTTWIGYSANRFGLQDPQGLAIDPASGTLFILDAVGPRILRVKPGPDGSLETAGFSEVKLKSIGLVAPRGLAFDPTTSHLHLISPAKHTLVEVTQAGQLVATRDLSGFHIGSPRGMVFAPSGDQTDDPAQVSLYLADSGLTAGRILEFSLVQPGLRAALKAASFTSALIRTIDTAAFSPPSPDPDGLVYLPALNQFLMCDSEVEETVSGITHFDGANLWYVTPTGSVTRTGNISYEGLAPAPMTDEPTGVTWDSANGHFFFTDDNSIKVWNLNPGADGWAGTADDTWTSFSTSSAGAGDPEDITYDDLNNQLFVLDGTNMEVYRFTTTGSLLSHFDVAQYNVLDPEGIAFNSASATLFVLSKQSTHLIIETTLSGDLLQTIDVAADNGKLPGGLAYAPASDGSGAKHFYIVDRGVDNNDDPTEIDGKIYEMSAPASSGTPTVTKTASMTPTKTHTPTATNTPLPRQPVPSRQPPQVH